MNRRTRLYVYLCIFISLVFISCGLGNAGWGVLIWSHDEAEIPSGAIIEVFEISSLKSTYTVGIPGSDTKTEIPQWRVEYFKKRKSAELLFQQYSEFSDQYAATLLNGLRLREEPEQNSSELYKLREGQVIKLLDRQPDKVAIGEYTGYWYKVLTGDGMAGYVFGHYLEVKNLEELTSNQDITEQDPFLTAFMNSNFRPVLFRDMLEEGRIDLRRFSPDFGIFPDPEKKKIVISNEEHTSVIEYTGITITDEVNFAFDGSSLLMIKKTPTEVNLLYSDDGTPYSEDYVNLNADMDLAIIQELERRRQLFESIAKRSTVLSSEVYGTITLKGSRRFAWEGYDRLIPDVIPAGTETEGMVDFNVFLSDFLQQTYNGALSFVFDSETAENQVEVAFLYTFQGTGIQFRYIPESLIKQNIIEQEGSAPLIIFLSFAE